MPPSDTSPGIPARTGEAFYRALFDHHPDGVIVVDPGERRFLFCDPRMGRLLGIDPANIGRLALTDVHPPESHEWVFREYERAVRGEVRCSTAVPVQRADGTVWLADIHTCGVSVDGRLCTLAVFHDVTARVKTQAMLEATLAKYRTLFGAFPIGITVARRRTARLATP